MQFEVLGVGSGWDLNHTSFRCCTVHSPVVLPLPAYVISDSPLPVRSALACHIIDAVRAELTAASSAECTRACEYARPPR